MKSVKLLVAGSFIFAMLMPVMIFRAVNAAVVALGTPLQCRFEDDSDSEPYFDSEGCDLAVNKQVKINAGPYQDADTEATAAQANVGDKVTWKITVSNPNSEETFTQPFGIVRVTDILPTAGVSYDGTSYDASVGNYSGNIWEFPLYEVGEPGHTNLPATLTIVTYSTATGLFKNTATLSAYNACINKNSCFWPETGGYQDANSDNNSNDAWIDPSAAPVVLAESTLANTGNGVVEGMVAGALIVSTLGILGYSRFSRKQS